MYIKQNKSPLLYFVSSINLFDFREVSEYSINKSTIISATKNLNIIAQYLSHHYYNGNSTKFFNKNKSHLHCDMMFIHMPQMTEMISLVKGVNSEYDLMIHLLVSHKNEW